MLGELIIRTIAVRVRSGIGASRGFLFRATCVRCANCSRFGRSSASVVSVLVDKIFEVCGMSCAVGRGIVDSANILGHEGVDRNQRLHRSEKGDASPLVSLDCRQASKSLFNARSADALDLNVQAEVIVWAPFVSRLNLVRELGECAPVRLPFGRDPSFPLVLLQRRRR